jgi:hypothetical protein
MPDGHDGEERQDEAGERVDDIMLELRRDVSVAGLAKVSSCCQTRSPSFGSAVHGSHLVPEKGFGFVAAARTSSFVPRS